MIIGFGFGSPLQSLLMLVVTSLLSYAVYRVFRQVRSYGQKNSEAERERRRAYYLEQRERARLMMTEFDLTDEQIERRLDQEFGRN